MRILGRPLHTLGQRYVIVRARSVPPLGAVVKTKNMRIGKIQEVFGPVKNPYVQIKLDDNIKIGKELKNNDKLYYSQPKRGERRTKPKPRSETVGRRAKRKS